MKKILLALVCAVIGLTAASHAWADAADPVLIGSYDGWKAYHFRDKGGEVCFMSRAPDKQEGKFKKRGPVVFFVTHYAGGKDSSVISVANGYAFKPKSPVTLAIKAKKFNLFTQPDKTTRADDMAWTKDQAEDAAVIKEILAGASMTVKGTSGRGTATTDTYSLKGSAEAYRAITKDCGAEKEPPAGKEKK